MNSRERVLMALNHEETDRVPIDLGSSRSTGINAIAYNKLKKYLGVDSKTVLFDVKQLLAEMDFEVAKRIGSDVVILPRLVPSVGIRIDKLTEGELPENGGSCLQSKFYHPKPLDNGGMGIYDKYGHLIAVRPKGGIFYDEVYHPLENAETEEDVDRGLSIADEDGDSQYLGLPQISDYEMRYLHDKAKYIYENTDFAISGFTSFSLFERGFKDFGYENYLMLFYEEPDLAEYYLDKMTDAYITYMERYLDAVGDYIQIVQNNDDLGSQKAMLISPEIYREFIKPRHAKINAAIKKKCPDMHISLHCDGSIYPIIGDIIESGFDILNPIQRDCDNMDPVQIKKEFGDRLTIWGSACSTQSTMTHGSIEDIVNEAKEMIRIFAPGGGFVFSQIHNILADIPPEKIVALFDTAKKYGVPEWFDAQ